MVGSSSTPVVRYISRTNAATGEGDEVQGADGVVWKRVYSPTDALPTGTRRAVLVNGTICPKE